MNGSNNTKADYAFFTKYLLVMVLNSNHFLLAFSIGESIALHVQCGNIVSAYVGCI